jgi:membrane-bound metal-dependent hydrolase YbcI (DUF457 family)
MSPQTLNCCTHLKDIKTSNHHTKQSGYRGRSLWELLVAIASFIHCRIEALTIRKNQNFWDIRLQDWTVVGFVD